MALTCNPEIRRIMVQGQHGQVSSRDSHLQNNQSKMDYSSRVPAFASAKSWVQTPISPKEKKKKENRLSSVQIPEKI
jgi:hypothetical protein